MLQYTVILCLCLLVVVKSFTVEQGHGLRVIDFFDPLPSHYLISSESINNGYAVVNFEETKSSPRKLHVELRVYNEKSNAFKECFFDLTTRSKAKKSGVSTLVQISSENVVLAWYDELSEGTDRLTRVVTMNSNDCQPSDIDLGELSGKVIVLPTTNDCFDVIISDEIICRDVGYQCRLSYDLKYQSFDVNPFDVNVDWSKLHIKHLDDQTFIAHGFQKGIYDAMLIDTSNGHTKNLNPVFESNPRLEFVSSELLFCWIVNPGEDVSVHCTQFNRHGKLIFARTIVFDEAVTLVNVHSFRDGEIFIITGKASCSNELDCWNLMSTRVNHDQSSHVKHSSLHFHCTGSRKRLAMSYDTDRQNSGLVNAQYACKYGNGYAYDHILIDANPRR